MTTQILPTEKLYAGQYTKSEWLQLTAAERREISYKRYLQNVANAPKVNYDSFILSALYEIIYYISNGLFEAFSVVKGDVTANVIVEDENDFVIKIQTPTQYFHISDDKDLFFTKKNIKVYEKLVGAKVFKKLKTQVTAEIQAKQVETINEPIEMNTQPTTTTTQIYPKAIVTLGMRLVAIGIGKFPYECRNKDKHPNAMIYQGESCWCSSESYEFRNRNTDLDEYEPVTIEPTLDELKGFIKPQPTQPQTLEVNQVIKCDGYRLVVTAVKEAKQSETQPTQEPANEPIQELSNEPIKPMLEKPTTPATYAKYCPNVFVAKCDQEHEKGSIIEIETKYGKIHEVEVYNLVAQKNGFFYYSIVRADGYNVQERAKQKAARYAQWANSADKKSTQYYEASNEGRDFLSLGEPIKVGHHSEKRHRALIERNWGRMGKSVKMSKKANFHNEKAAYWADKADTINLSMPESIGYFEFKLKQAKKELEGLKNGTIKRSHSFSLTYAKKTVNELEDKVKTAHKLWA